MKKLVTKIIEAIICFMVGVGFTALGWNVFLCRLFPQLPVFDFKQLVMLTAGIYGILTYHQMCIDKYTKYIVKGDED